MDCFICHRSNWMQEKCLGFLRNLLENYKDMIEDADVFLPLECPGADELLVRLVREEIPQDVIERMSERSRRGFLLELDDDPVHTTLERALYCVSTATFWICEFAMLLRAKSIAR